MLGIYIVQQNPWHGFPYAAEEWGFPDSQSSDTVRLWEQETAHHPQTSSYLRSHGAGEPDSALGEEEEAKPKGR